MGLESATYIGGLTPSWPLAGDQKQQGDDHIRLLKSVLQATFPTATKPFYFPKAETFASNQVLDITDQNNILAFDTNGGNWTVTLPTLAAGDQGWRCEVMKMFSDTNAVLVSPPSGTILSQAGATATIRVGIVCQPATFFWNGVNWICWKYGSPVGSTINFDGPSVPPGYLVMNGAAYSNTAFAELFAMLGTSTLTDKRGRVEAGEDGGTGRIGNPIMNGVGRGSVGGEMQHLLITGEIPSHVHANFITDPGHVHPVKQYDGGSVNAGGGFGGVGQDTFTGSNSTGITLTNAAAGGGAVHNNMQPTIITQKLIRAC